MLRYPTKKLCFEEVIMISLESLYLFINLKCGFVTSQKIVRVHKMPVYFTKCNGI